MAEEFNPDLVSVIDEDGVEHIFEELDRIETDTAKYVALIPVYDDAEDILDDDGEVIILKVEEDKDGETYLCPIENAKEFDEVQAIFEERLNDLFEDGDEN
ncbi:MAG: DUF1292 domain-containing protein [Clostridia bacterium]|nr:DUF1292 domain-containing protein [Clostridia bacterium]